MSWRDNLQPASFRGVEFFYDSSSTSVGRRVALHEYPKKDKPYAEDMGRAAREYSLDIFVIGDDYQAQRDQLIAAIEKKGSGKLVHPRMGELTVTVTEKVQVSESTREGGMARFQITFVETGDKQYPDNKVNTKAQSLTAADNALSTVGTEFEDRFQVTGLPEFVEEDALTIFDDWLGNVISMASISGLIPAQVTQFLATAYSIKNKAATLLRTPGVLVSEVLGLWGQVAGLFPESDSDSSSFTSEQPAAQRAYTAIIPLAEYTPPQQRTLSSTPSDQQIQINRTVLTDLVLSIPVITQAQISTEMEFDSYQDAVTVRDQIADTLDERSETASDTLYPVLQNLRVAVVKDISNRGADLARLVSYTPSATLPALVIAHKLYQDATRDEEIVARNKISHPGFVTGGQALEVLSYE